MESAPDAYRDIEKIFAAAAVEAGREIMAAIGESLTALRKADGTPVTQADLRAEAVIRARLGQALPGIPVIGEEGGASAVPDGGVVTGILVDPLDGTRDCLAGSPEFTVNIALVEAGRAVCGVVHAPAFGRLYAGSLAGGAWRMEVPRGCAFESAPRQALRVRRVPADGLVALESRSHRDPASEALAAHFGIAGRRAVGSSLKFALLAAGEADLYARAVSLNGWDIAAGDAVLTAAGGAVLTFEGEPIRYALGGLSPRAPQFVAIGDPALRRFLPIAQSKDAAAP